MIGVLLSKNLEGWLRANSEFLLAYPFVLSVLLAIPLLVGALWAWRLAGEIIASRRPPPPGMKVIKDTRVESGERANRRGIVIRLIAGVIFVCACAMAMMMWLLITSVGKSSEADRPAESAVLDATSK